MTTTTKLENMTIGGGIDAKVMTVTLKRERAQLIDKVLAALPAEIQNVEILILIDMILNTYNLRGEQRLKLLELLALHGVGAELVKEGAN